MYSLIVVDYNSIESTIAYIGQCQKALGSQGASHVVVIDNADNEVALQLLSKAFGTYTQMDLPELERSVQCFRQDSCTICYCNSGENFGYARGNNLGAQIAKAMWDDPFYIISNNDLEFNGTVDLTVTDTLFAAHPEVAVIGPRVVTPLGKPQSPRFWQGAFRRLIVNTWLLGAAGAILSEEAFQKLSDRYCNDTVFDATTGPCAWVSGCFMIIRADAFYKAGMFDEHTFLYAEEPILSRRIEAIGSQVWFCRELEVIHNHAQTTKKALSVLKMRQIEFEANWYYHKTYGHTSALLLTLAKWNFALYKGLFSLWQKVRKTKR